MTHADNISRPDRMTAAVMTQAADRCRKKSTEKGDFRQKITCFSRMLQKKIKIFFVLCTKTYIYMWCQTKCLQKIIDPMTIDFIKSLCYNAKCTGKFQKL